ncbi:MAG: V-type ATP synthase subunit D [Pseudomonadota bacterium]
MARLQLNKSSLARETASLKAYERFLPSLDLKRRQLMAESAKEVKALSQTNAEIEDVVRDIGAAVPMMANTDISLDGLVVVKEIQQDYQNIVGVKLPQLGDVVVVKKPYGRLTKPHWVDVVAAKLEQAIILNLRKDIQSLRVSLLEEAVKIVAQRVNLFEKVLIPRSKENIKRIKIYLSDEQVSAVVRSKMAKRKRAAIVDGHSYEGAMP